MLIIAQVLKEKNVEKSPVLLIHKQQTDLWIKLPSGQDRKKLPALGTNQIARFGGFRPLASLEKNKCAILFEYNIMHLFLYQTGNG